MDGDLAHRAWRGLFDFFVATRAQRDQALERLGLTPNDARALSGLSPDEGRTMSALASEWGTDASTVTWVVDRLERKGWVERRPVPHDRRVRSVVLTSHGVEAREALTRALHRPPPEVLAMDPDDLREIARIFGPRS